MLEEQAHVRKMAEESVRLEVERIMRELAHDLKEPARAIASFTEIVLDRGDDLEEARRRDFLERANRGAHRIIDMIQEMRSYALATAGNRNGSIEMISFHKAVDEALGRMDRKIELSDARIERAIGVGDKSLVAESVIRVIQNLVENSIKYSLDDQDPQIWLSATEEDGSVLVEVRDAGMGFDAESSGHIFEPFHRLKPHDEKAGVGMGLAISHNIITKLGGRIWAQSDGEGKGATVFFRVPTQRKDEGEDEQAEQADRPAC
jgi:signal transduction histidine kinase